MSKSYMRQHTQRLYDWKEKLPEYLSGLFTSKYGDEFYMHFLCPLCNGQVNAIKKLGLKSGDISIDFEKDVAGQMANDMRKLLAEHYQKECGYDHERRKQTGEILIDKFQDKVYK